jgi:hypothetical protein
LDFLLDKKCSAKDAHSRDRNMLHKCNRAQLYFIKCLYSLKALIYKECTKCRKNSACKNDLFDLKHILTLSKRADKRIVILKVLFDFIKLLPRGVY